MPKITGLPPGFALNAADLFPYEQGGVTKSITFATLQSAVANAGVVQSLINQSLSSGFSHAGLASNTTYTAPGGGQPRSVTDRLSDYVEVFDYMTSAQRSDVVARTNILDVSAAFALAFLIGGLVHARDGTYRLNNPSFSVQSNSGLVGNGRGTIFNVTGAGTPDRSAMATAPSLSGALFVGSGGNLFRDFVVQAGDTFDYNKTYESWTAYNYTCNNHLIAIAAGSDTIVERVHCQQVFLPLGAQNQSRIKIDKLSSDRSAFAAIWTSGCSKISVSHGDWDRCGAFGGVVFSNVNDLSITNTAWLFNPESTGIDIGGGGTTAKRIAISGNNIFSGDPIGIEDGGSDITITGNRCSVAPGYITNIDLTGINCQLHDVANTPVNDVVISGNSVCFLNPDLTYHDFLGTCIDVGGVTGGQNSSDVTISGNMCRGGEASIDVHGLAGTTNQNLAITGNNCTHNFYGLKLETTSVGFVGGNLFSCGKSVTTAGTYGIYMLFGDINDVVFSANETIGYQFHFQQDVPGAPTNLNCTRSVVQSHSFLANPGDLGGFTEYRNSGSGADLNLRPLKRIQQGITTASNLMLGYRGNKFALLGTNTVSLLDRRDWNDGDDVFLMAQAGATRFKNNQLGSGTFTPILLATGSDYLSGPGGLGVLYLGLDKSSLVFREFGRVG